MSEAAARLISPLLASFASGEVSLQSASPGREANARFQRIPARNRTGGIPPSSSRSLAIQRTAGADPRAVLQPEGLSQRERSVRHPFAGRIGPLAGRAIPLPSRQASRCIRTRRQSTGPPQRRTDCFVSSRLAMPWVVRAERSPGQDRHFRRKPLRRTKRASRRCRRRSFPPPFPRS